ncbi:MAG: sodium:solute symporter [Vicingus serpentipes]|nr:sodium:solute symporter [Vicingus serpentipes]
MSIVDWIIMLGTLGFIVAYGTWKTRKNANLQDYLRGGNEMKWTTIGLSVMATQASAITFISTPGQAYESGMGFVQNYFGLPIALIIVSAVFIPIYYRLKVYTAYEYLETRFGVASRMLAAFLFLVQRGLAAGITIYAPAIILSTALGWNLSLTILLIGVLVIIYTVSGGTKAVSLTQKWQMGVIMSGMFIAFFIIIYKLPHFVSFGDAISVAGIMGKLDIVDFSLDIDKRYTFWTGITGGTFLALSYFGTDQSQVQRYLSGSSVYESRMGLMFNAILKIPMQFFILLVGVMVFVFFQYQEHAVLFNQNSIDKVYETEYADEMKSIEADYSKTYQEKKVALTTIVQHYETNEKATEEAIKAAQEKETEALKIRDKAKELVNKAVPDNKSKDSDYVFLSFIMNYLPMGLIGLLLAVIFSAAMSSTSGELNALATTTTIDFYKRLNKKEHSEQHYVNTSKIFTAGWGVVAIAFALFAHLVENLIEAVNILGSIFYGVILGIFLIAFFLKNVKGKATFSAAIIGQSVVIILFFFGQQIGSYLLGREIQEIAYLWYNVIGCSLVVLIALLISPFENKA